jgi:hypothetical protein
MKLPLRIVSDLHLGHRGSRVETAEQLAPLIEGVGTLVSNGDTFQELSSQYREQGRRLFDEWRGMMADRGVEFIALPGNHDPGVGDSHSLDLQDGAVFVSHGDAIFAENAPWKRMVPKLRGEIAEAFRQAGPEADSPLLGRGDASGPGGSDAAVVGEFPRRGGGVSRALPAASGGVHLRAFPSCRRVAEAWPPDREHRIIHAAGGGMACRFRRRVDVDRQDRPRGRQLPAGAEDRLVAFRHGSVV